MIKVLIADDHPVFTNGLKTLLNSEHNIRVVGESLNGYEAVQAARVLSPDVILMDIRMPLMNGIEATKKIMDHDNAMKVIALTGTNHEEQIIDMLRVGAKGYLLKNYDHREIARAIAKVNEGEEYFCKEAIEVILQRFSKSNPDLKNLFRSHSFQEKELQIIRYICQQKTAREISELLFVSEKTVDFHRQRIIEKMGVRNIVGLVVYAIKNRIVELEEIL